MKQIRSPLRGRALIVGALALVPAATLASPASATSTLAPTVTAVNYTCRIGTNIFPFPVVIEGDAPVSVEPGEDFKIVIKPPDNLPAFVPQTIDDQEVVELTEARLRIDLPTNATFHSASLTGGSGFSSADVDEIDEGLLETIRGPVPGGGQFVFPDLTIKVEADFPDTQIETIAGGTSFNKPGIEQDFKIRDTTGNIVNVTQTCFPDQKTVLTTTTVGSENNNNGEHHAYKPHKPHKLSKPHKACD